MIHFVIGTRAQLFKMAPVMLECQKQNLKWRWVYTAQHKETMSSALKTFDIPDPDYILFDWETEAKTMKKLWYWLFRSMIKLFSGRKILDGYTGKKHIVLTHGDTITTWWGALLGRLYGCRVMHVESGLRSFNLFKPFPEEIDRLITFRLSNVYACPGDWALENLAKYKGDKINTFQNTQIDTLQVGLANCEKAKIDITNDKYTVVSIHRYENIFNKEQFEKIINHIAEISGKFHVYWVQHPATKEQLNKYEDLGEKLKNKSITLLPRLEYLQFIKLVRHSEFVISDGGGNQEELYFMGKPNLIFRNESERNEGLGANAVLSKFDKNIINEFIKNYKSYRKKPVLNTNSPSKIIVDYLREKEYGKI